MAESLPTSLRSVPSHKVTQDLKRAAGALEDMQVQQHRQLLDPAFRPAVFGAGGPM